MFALTDEDLKKLRRDPQPQAQVRGGQRNLVPQNMPGVPAGRYAVENQKGILRFYRVSRPDKGKWRGWVFLSVYGSDEEYPIKERESKRWILQAILDDPDAGPRYGREIGLCYVCGRTLTDEESRMEGIGPICKDKRDG